MIRVKRLYTFVLGTFLPLLLATFSVCLFILLMLFLWQHIGQMVGKGVGIGVLAELFFYASLSSTPMALPLAVLLASLMTFGNLGEHLELLAMKASGISLIRIMKPLIYLAVGIVVVSFVFQNDIVPRAQTKMYTTLFSLRQKSPELVIPEGIFSKEIEGYNVYPRKKDPKRELLLDLMIYDYSKGFQNLVVMVADSGRLRVSEDKTHLILTLYNGEAFQNLETRKTNNINENIPSRRETFDFREFLIPFDTNFNMADESIMGNRDLGKNMNQLTAYIDSVQLRQDSLVKESSPHFRRNIYINTFKQDRSMTIEHKPNVDSLLQKGFDVYFDNLHVDARIRRLQEAKNKAEQIQMDYTLSIYQQNETQKQLRLHSIQLHKRFALAFACLLFFFIGAPLGAIIRKGGLGMPVVLAVILFLLYHTIDTFGTKLAREGAWTVLEGIWLSTVVLAALGIFFTYKAVNDSTMMNPDAWKIFLQKLIGKKELRNYTKKEVIMTPPDYSKDIENLKKWNEEYESYLKEKKETTFGVSQLQNEKFNHLIKSLENTIEDLLNSDENLIIGKLMDYPIMQPTNNWLFIFKQKSINKELRTIKKLNENLIAELEKILPS
jgi:lipopolysaccharide export system permease protein